MRFVTFNVSSGRGGDGHVDVDRFAAAIAALDPDVLALQEVDRGQERSHGADLTAVAGRAMGAQEQLFAPTLYGTPGVRWTAAGDESRPGPAYGCALLSRYPFSRSAVWRMPAVPVALPLWVPGQGVVVVREEPRVAIVGHLELGRDRSLTVVGTHLPFVPVWNRLQLRRLADRAREWPDPLLLMGDLNVRGGAPARVTGYTGLVDGPTFPAARPRFQLDHVLLRGQLPAGAVLASVPQSTVSDHRPVVVDLDPDAVHGLGEVGPDV